MIDAPTLPCGHELWVVTERMWPEMSFPSIGWLGFSLTHGVNRFSRHVQPEGAPRVDTEHAGEVIYLIPQGSCKMLLARGTSGLSCLACCHRDLALDKWRKTYTWMTPECLLTPTVTSYPSN